MTDAGTERVETTDASRSLGLRMPATSVIAECLRIQASSPSRTALQRFFGVSPLSRKAEPWYLGALGELEVANRLRSLGPGWYVLHAVPVGTAGSDLDHVAIGSAGVFTINSKNHRGRDVWVGARRLLVNGQRTDHLRNAKYEAVRTAKQLSAAVRGPVTVTVTVTPIIAIVGARRITVRERPADVIILRETELVRWLQHRPEVLSPEQLHQLAYVAALPETWSRTDASTGAGATAADMAAFQSLCSEIDRARHRRRGWTLALVAALPISLIVAWNALIGVLMQFASGSGG